MRTVRLLLFGLLLVGCGASGKNEANTEQPASPDTIAPVLSAATTPLEVLFVGNSYIFYNDMPELVVAMAASQGLALTVTSVTHPGSDWAHHLGSAAPALDEISSGNYDVVILQNHSLSTRDPDSFSRDGKALIDAIESSGAVPVLYVTWARRDTSIISQQQITAVYEQLALDEGAVIAPVGPIWQTVRDDNSAIGNQLFAPDGSHPSPLGSYLIATVFCRLLTGNSVLAVPATLGEIAIAPARADYLRSVVENYPMASLDERVQAR